MDRNFKYVTGFIWTIYLNFPKILYELEEFGFRVGYDWIPKPHLDLTLYYSCNLYQEKNCLNTNVSIVTIILKHKLSQVNSPYFYQLTLLTL